ncbi:MAG: hypothetical protein O2U61_01805 [Candidatus Bathyarchaeota archaeon]|nr:hypothetical protein [Candidatus Bathyarchaeota archaeon]
MWKNTEDRKYSREKLYQLQTEGRYEEVNIIRFSSIDSNESVYRLVHLKDINKITVLVNDLQLDKKQKEKVNELRKLCKNDTI